MPIPVPLGVEVIIEGSDVTVKGPMGELSRSFDPAMSISLNDGIITVSRPSDTRVHRSLHGLTRSLVANMVEGVNEGVHKNLEIVGVGYRARQEGEKVVIQAGYSHLVEVEPRPGVELVVVAPTQISVRGIDKVLVGDMAARIRAIRPPDRYKGKGIRYVGERIRLKPGKAGKVGAKKR